MSEIKKLTKASFFFIFVDFADALLNPIAYQSAQEARAAALCAFEDVSLS